MFNLPEDNWNLRLLKSPQPALSAVRQQAIEYFNKELSNGALKTEPLHKCPCGCSDFVHISSQDRFGLSFSTHLCRSCGLLCTNPVLSDACLPHYYREHYHTLLCGHKNAKDNFAFRPGNGTKVFSRLPPLKKTPIRVLEVGSGSGLLLQEFRQAATQQKVIAQCLCTEYSPEMVKACQARGLDAIEGSIEDVLCLDKQFDVVILSHVLEHVRDINKFIKCVKKTLRPFGLLYVEVPGLMDLHEKSEYHFDFLEYMIHCHIYHFNLNSLAYHVGKNGLKFISGSEIAYGVFMNIPTDATYEPPLPSSFNHIELFCYLRFMEKNFTKMQGNGLTF